MKKIIILFFLILTIADNANCNEPFAKWTKTELTLNNGIVSRVINLPAVRGNFLTVSYKPVNGDFNSLSDTCTDFQFEINNMIYSGKGQWNLSDIQVITDNNEGSGAAVKLISQDKNVELTLKFLLYPNSPTVVPDFIRKYMGIRLSELKEKPTFVYNTWIPFTGNINEKLVMELAKAAANAGMKEFIIDDGWQDSYGDWGIDMKKFPNGLKPVFDYIKGILLKLKDEYGLEYFKLDFAVVTSAYTYDHTESGCYSANHPGHKDHNESLYTNYELLWQLFDELHAAWWRSPAIPATSLVIGNPQMQDSEWETHIKSIAGALPVMLGDPRMLCETDLKKYRSYADWLQEMEIKYNIMSFRQDLQGFGEPMEGMWDGFQRINTETKNGGILGIFRHGSVEIRRTVIVNYLDPEKTYQVKAIAGNVIATLTGTELKKKGFTVDLNGLYSGDLYEICLKE